MKAALYDVSSGLVLQWQDTSQFAFSAPAAGQATLALADSFVFPTSPRWVVGGSLTITDPNAPTAAQQLASAQGTQIVAMYAAYQSAIAQDVSFTTAAGVVKTYQADAVAIDNAQKMVAAYGASGVPAGFYWVAKDNARVPFTLADLQGLAKAMGDQGWAAFQRLQDRKASIRAAATVAAVQAVVW